FFFSSRRRHTRSDRDWSSDVCSSDLHTFARRRTAWRPLRLRHRSGHWPIRSSRRKAFSCMARVRDPKPPCGGIFGFAREGRVSRSEEHTSELQSRSDLVCRLLLEKKK